MIYLSLENQHRVLLTRDSDAMLCPHFAVLTSFAAFNSFLVDGGCTES